MDFIGRNVFYVGILVVVAGLGAIIGVVGSLSKRSAVAIGVVAMTFAPLCVGIGWLQHVALVRAVESVRMAPGLSHGDRLRIMARDASDASTAMYVALVFAMVPVVAGGIAFIRRGAIEPRR